MYTKETKNSSRKRSYLPVVLAVLLVGIAVVFYFMFFRTSGADPTISYSPKYSNEDSTNPEQTNPADKEGSSDTNPLTSEEVPRSTIGSVTIDDLEQKNGFVNAKADVANFSIVSCVYSFTSEGARPIVREQSGACSGVSIPQVEFEKIGAYTLTVSAYDQKHKISTSREIVIR